jgi:rhamnogalacturonan acetylesterase
VIISSPTPDNPWITGNYSWTPTRYAYYSWYIASSLGGPARGIYYVDHGNYAAAAVKNLGMNVTNENYPMDDVHTKPFLADVFAQAFVLGLKCGTAGLQNWVVNATARLEGSVLATCQGVNATLPV